MQEVSGKANQALLHVLARRGIPAERLVDGLPLSVDEMADPDRRMDWDLHVQILERIEGWIGLEELEIAGTEVLDLEHLSTVRALAGHLVTPRRLYWMACRWWGPSYFTHVRYSLSARPSGVLCVSLEIREGLPAPPAFFAINRGWLRRTPCLLGLPDADVEFRVHGSRAEYTIYPPRQRSLWAALSSLLGFEVAAEQAVEALAVQQEDLNRSYTELSRAREALGAQRGQLESIDALGRSLATQIEAQHLGDGLLEALRERFGWSGAALWVAGPEEDGLELVSASGGAPGSPLAHALTAGGRRVGRLDVWGLERPDDPVHSELFERLIPWIAMAVANAHRDARPDGGERLERFRWSGGERDKELFLIIDANARVRYAGPTVEQILGIDQETAVDRNVAELIHEEDFPALEATFMSFGDGPGSATFSGVRLRHADGTWRVLEGVGIKVQDEHRRPVFMFSSSDVSDRQRPH